MLSSLAGLLPCHSLSFECERERERERECECEWVAVLALFFRLCFVIYNVVYLYVIIFATFVGVALSAPLAGLFWLFFLFFFFSILCVCVSSRFFFYYCLVQRVDRR